MQKLIISIAQATIGVKILIRMAIELGEIFHYPSYFPGHNHTRSANKVAHYGTDALSCKKGYISDLIRDPYNLTLRYLVKDPRDLYPDGRHALVSPNQFLRFVGEVNSSPAKYIQSR